MWLQRLLQYTGITWYAWKPTTFWVQLCGQETSIYFLLENIQYSPNGATQLRFKMLTKNLHKGKRHYFFQLVCGHSMTSHRQKWTKVCIFYEFFLYTRAWNFVKNTDHRMKNYGQKAILAIKPSKRILNTILLIISACWKIEQYYWICKGP